VLDDVVEVEDAGSEQAASLTRGEPATRNVQNLGSQGRSLADAG
jgi:hypothetical protein